MCPMPSPLAVTAAKVGDRWSLLVVEALLGGPMRFNGLAEVLNGIAPTVLSQRLKHLEREGVVVARAYSSRPPRFSYALTAAGEELAGAVRLLTDWGATYGEGDEEQGAGPTHSLCGTQLQTRWVCPTCGVVVEDPAVDELHYA